MEKKTHLDHNTKNQTICGIKKDSNNVNTTREEDGVTCGRCHDIKNKWDIYESTRKK